MVVGHYLETARRVFVIVLLIFSLSPMPRVASSQRQPQEASSRRRRVNRSGSMSSPEGKATKNRKTSSMTDLTIEIPTTSTLAYDDDRKEKDRYSLNGTTAITLSPEDQSMDEGAAEEWLTSPRIASRRKERRELFAASAAALRRTSYENYESPVHRCMDARSSVSSPGTSGMRERIQRDLVKEEFHKRMQRSGVLHEVETNTAESKNSSNLLHHHQQQNQQQPQQPQHVSDSLVTEKKQLRRATSERRVERPPPMRRLSSMVEASRSKDDMDASTRPIKGSSPKATAAAQSKRKKSSATSPQVIGEDALLLRLSRQVRLGRKGELPYLLQRRTNKITLHVYDLISKETIMLLPFGCDFPIGRFFNVLNSGLHSLGTGAYHVGVEVNGIEYAYGANNVEGSSGVFTCVPKCSPGYQFRTSIDFGERALSKRCWVNIPKIVDKHPDGGGFKQMPNGSCYREVETFIDGRSLVKEMAAEYMGKDYDLLRKNCCTFAIDVCRRLGVPEEEIPSWFRNLADAGAKTKDVALSTFEPIQFMLSSCENCSGENLVDSEGDCGFEVIAKRKEGALTKTEMEIVKVVEAEDSSQRDGGSNSGAGSNTSPVGFRRTLSWTY